MDGSGESTALIQTRDSGGIVYGNGCLADLRLTVFSCSDIKVFHYQYYNSI